MVNNVLLASGLTSSGYVVHDIPKFRSHEADYPWMSSSSITWIAGSHKDHREVAIDAASIISDCDGCLSAERDWALHMRVFASGTGTRVWGSGFLCGETGNGFGVFLLPRCGRTVVRFVWAWQAHGTGVVDFEPHSLRIGAWEFINITHGIDHGFRLWSGRIARVVAQVYASEVTVVPCNTSTLGELSTVGASAHPVALLIESTRRIVLGGEMRRALHVPQRTRGIRTQCPQHGTVFAIEQYGGCGTYAGPSESLDA